MAVQNAAPFTSWTDQSLERQVLDEVSLDVPWEIVERFSGLVRSSGSPEERQAFELLVQRLQEWGVPHKLHEPEAFISIPGPASVEVDGKTFRAKTPAMSVSTNGEPHTADIVYMPSGGGERAGDVFSTGVDLEGVDVAGKIVLTEGMASPGKVFDVMNAGAVGGIYINPGQAIHEGICTTIWGAPDLGSVGRQPTIPVVAVNNPDGQELIELAKSGAQVSLQTSLDTGWRRIPVLTAEIPGSRVPEEFVLLHGHLDSWHVGIGDNATGDATMLELARVFWQHRARLDRTLRICWWSGHSHGRYAGSTWYSDTFGIELARNCVAQVNCDSPGCRWANTYNELNAMSEAEPYVTQVIEQTTGITPVMERPHRAGDYSFNDIGITSFYMLSSTMSQELRDEKGYYAVGGCGANIEWHTEGDTMDIADRDVLLRDMKMYAASVLRVLDAPLLPFDWTKTIAEFRRHLASFQDATGEDFDFSSATQALDSLESALQRFYDRAPQGTGSDDERTRRFNFVQRRLARLLVHVNFSAIPMFFHDAALSVPPLPDLAPALSMPAVRDDVHLRGVLRTQLTRGQNRLVWTLLQAEELVLSATA